MKVRASFLRYLALGGCDACLPHEKGLQVQGAYVEGDGDPALETPGLDLEGCDVARDIYLVACRFPDQVIIQSATLRTLGFDGSVLMNGLSGDRADIKGDLFLRNAEASGEVRLGAKMPRREDRRTSKVPLSPKRRSQRRGPLPAKTAALWPAPLTASEGGTGWAFAADGADIKGSLFLHNAKASGEVRCLGAKIGGDLDCDGATFTATKGNAFDASGAEVSGRSASSGDKRHRFTGLLWF